MILQTLKSELLAGAGAGQMSLTETRPADATLSGSASASSDDRLSVWLAETEPPPLRRAIYS